MGVYDSFEEALAEWEREDELRPVELTLRVREAQALATMADELGYDSPSAWVQDCIQEYGAARRAARLRSIAERMWPNGAPDTDAMTAETDDGGRQGESS